MKVIILTVIAVLLYAGGEVISKLYANTGILKYAVIAVLLDAVVFSLWLPALQQKNSVALLGSIWTLCFALASTIVGLLIFKEHLSTSNYIGLGIALVALYFLCK